MVLGNLEPKRVWYYFEELSKIPRGSGNMRQVGEFCMQIAKKLKLDCERDEAGNIIIRKAASVGYEKMPGIILQGHLDMVCVNIEEKRIDFEKEGISVCTDGKKVWADGTTLGADNGIAVAYALAVLENNNIMHPALEVLLTVDEEIGLIGATEFDATKLQGTRLLNLDSEEEGILTVSCAGGSRAICHLPLEREEARGSAFSIQISKLQGGHSGMEIDKNRTNAIVLLGRILNYMKKEVAFRIAAVNGGAKDNAIAAEANAVIYLEDEMLERMEEVVLSYKCILEKELRNTEPNFKLEAKKIDANKSMLSEDSTNKVIFMLYHLPDGIQKRNPQLEGLVQSSLNVGILSMREDEMITQHSIRSSVASEKQEIKDKVVSLVQFLGGEVEFRGEYPAWEYKADSELREISVKAYKNLYGTEPEITAIHAGLECGIFAGKKEELDCISFGPNLSEVHTPRECAEVASVARVWDYLLEILKYKE